MSGPKDEICYVGLRVYQQLGCEKEVTVKLNEHITGRIGAMFCFDSEEALHAALGNDVAAMPLRFIRSRTWTGPHDVEEE